MLLGPETLVPPQGTHVWRLLRAGCPSPSLSWAWPWEPTLVLTLSGSLYPTHWLPLVA